MNPLELLEQWNRGHKSRSVALDRDDGYGANCWHVELRGRGKKVDAWEVSFFEVEQKDVPPEVVYAVPPWEDNDGDWPGLGPTILAALKRADELGL